MQSPIGKRTLVTVQSDTNMILKFRVAGSYARHCITILKLRKGGGIKEVKGTWRKAQGGRGIGGRIIKVL
jgi:hypothetical protein